MDHPAKVLAALGFSPRKGLGQNFLADGNIARKIVETAVDEDEWVVEIGPGLGALTFLLEEKAKVVKAIEVDRGLAGYLREHVGKAVVEIVEGDVLKIGEEVFASWSKEAGSRIKIVGNLPYSISGPLIFRLIELRRYLSRCFVMLQREVATRIASPPGGKDYGAISVILQAVGKVEVRFPVSRNCFYPVPEVDSSFVEIDFARGDPFQVDDFHTFTRIVHAAFSGRRKVIRNALVKHLASMGIEGKDRLGELLGAAGIQPGERPERISVEQFVKLANLIR